VVAHHHLQLAEMERLDKVIRVEHLMVLFKQLRVAAAQAGQELQIQVITAAQAELGHHLPFRELQRITLVAVEVGATQLIAEILALAV
jgi:hypothetical protein